MAVEADDQFLVNRGGTTYTQEQETLMANLETDDLLLINRGGTSYTITWQEFVESVIDPLDIEVILNNVDPAPGDTITATAVVFGGKTPYGPVSYQWKKQENISRALTDIPGETNPTIIVTDDLLGYDLLCECSVTDAFGISVTVQSEPTEEVAPDGEITEPVVIISPVDGAGMAPESVTPAAEGIINAVENVISQSAWNQDQVWSNNVTGSGGMMATQGAAELFNGKLTGDENMSLSNDSGEGAYVEATFTGLTVENKVEVYIYKQHGPGQIITTVIDGVSEDYQVTSDKWVTVRTGSGNLESVRCTIANVGAVDRDWETCCL